MPITYRCLESLASSLVNGLTTIHYITPTPHISNIAVAGYVCPDYFGKCTDEKINHDELFQ